MINDISFLHRIAAILDMILAVLSRLIIPQIGRGSEIGLYKHITALLRGCRTLRKSVSTDKTFHLLVAFPN